MISLELQVAFAILIPLVGAVGITVSSSSPNFRDAVTLVTAGALFANVMSILAVVWGGASPAITIISNLPGLDIAFKVEPLGMIFAC
ncbi:MAG: hypothetical protein V7740_15305, partial [Pseudomonas marincola]